MTLHWEWIPLIITVFFLILQQIFERDDDWGPITFIASFCASWSIIIYIVLGIRFLYYYVNII